MTFKLENAAMIISHFRLTVLKISRNFMCSTEHMIKNSSNLFKFLQIQKINPKRALWALKARVCAYLFTGHACVWWAITTFHGSINSLRPGLFLYQFDWMICNMSPLIWFGGTARLSGFNQLLPPPGLLGGRRMCWHGYWGESKWS